MTIFDRRRLPPATFQHDVAGLRAGRYADKYFANVSAMLAALAARGYHFAGRSPRLDGDLAGVATGDLEVEMQWFTRRPGTTVVSGVDESLALLRAATGYFAADGRFVETWRHLRVEAVHDGAQVTYAGDPRRVAIVLRVRGRYRDFALLETTTLGALTRGSRVATNVYQALSAAGGKPLLFFPARFDLHATQASDGYAYHLAVQRYNHEHGTRLASFVSTDAQGAWWGGQGGGTLAHAAIACFLGDTAETMLAFAATIPPAVARVALVDFNNDSVADSLHALGVLFARYRAHVDNGDEAQAQRYVLSGVRLDTSGNVRDASVAPLGDPALDLGVNPRLVFNVRAALDEAWTRWPIPPAWRERAQTYCRNVRIIVSGGFSPEKIRRFERLAAPVDVYAVGSYTFDNHAETNTDFTADVVRVNLQGRWTELAKLGRAPSGNPELEPVDLETL